MWNKDLQKSVINFGFLIRFYWNHCIPIMCLHEHLTSGEVKCNDFNSQYHGFKPIMNFWKSSLVFPRIIPNLLIIRYSRVSITDHASKIWLPGCSNLAMNGENDNNVGICRRDITVNFFWRCRVSLVKFNYWSKLHGNISTGSEVMTIFVYKGLNRNPEIGNIPVWVLPNIWRLGQVRDTKFSANVSSEKLLNAAKCQGYSLYRFWVIKGKLTPTSPILGLRKLQPAGFRKHELSIFIICLHQ